eukprot:321943-Chlamydomonas_euryale.AAC.2
MHMHTHAHTHVRTRSQQYACLHARVACRSLDFGQTLMLQHWSSRERRLEGDDAFPARWLVGAGGLLPAPSALRALEVVMSGKGRSLPPSALSALLQPPRHGSGCGGIGEGCDSVCGGSDGGCDRGGGGGVAACGSSGTGEHGSGGHGVRIQGGSGGNGGGRGASLPAVRLRSLILHQDALEDGHLRWAEARLGSLTSLSLRCRQHAGVNAGVRWQLPSSCDASGGGGDVGADERIGNGSDGERMQEAFRAESEDKACAVPAVETPTRAPCLESLSLAGPLLLMGLPPWLGSAATSLRTLLLSGSRPPRGRLLSKPGGGGGGDGSGGPFFPGLAPLGVLTQLRTLGFVALRLAAEEWDALANVRQRERAGRTRGDKIRGKRGRTG